MVLAAFTELVRILPNTQHDACRVKIGTGAHWTFLADEELEVQRHFGINEYTDTHHDNAGVPHTLILSPGLRIEKVYVGYWFWGRPSPEQLWLIPRAPRTSWDRNPPRRGGAAPGGHPD